MHPCRREQFVGHLCLRVLQTGCGLKEIERVVTPSWRMVFEQPCVQLANFQRRTQRVMRLNQIAAVGLKSLGAMRVSLETRPPLKSLPSSHLILSKFLEELDRLHGA